MPFGVTGPVLAEAGRRFERRRARSWERLSWAAGLAAAASLVVVVALSLGGASEEPALERSADGVTGAEAPAPAATEAASGLLAFLGLERQLDVTYDDPGVRSLARDAAALVSGEHQTAEGVAGNQAFGSPDEALACVRRSGGPTTEPRDSLVRLIEAEYRGTPAYLAVFAEGPGAGQPPDTILVWVASKGDCSILTIASLRI